MGAASRGLRLARLLLLSGALVVLWLLLAAQDSSAATDGASTARAVPGLGFAKSSKGGDRPLVPAVVSTVDRVSEATLTQATRASTSATRPSTLPRKDLSAGHEKSSKSGTPAPSKAIGAIDVVRVDVVPTVSQTAQTSVASVDEVRSSALEATTATTDALGLGSLSDPLLQVAGSVSSSLVVNTAAAAGEVLDVVEELPLPELALPRLHAASATAPGGGASPAASGLHLGPAGDSTPVPQTRGGGVVSDGVSGAARRAAQGAAWLGAGSSTLSSAPSAGARSIDHASHPLSPVTPANLGASPSAGSSQGSGGHDVAGEGTAALVLPSAAGVSMTPGNTPGRRGPQLLPGFSPE